jgi:hypothetical protein
VFRSDTFTVRNRSVETAYQYATRKALIAGEETRDAVIKIAVACRCESGHEQYRDVTSNIPGSK